METSADLPRSGIVLSGGGAYGAYEVGVIKALYDGKSSSTCGIPLDPEVFSGTSVGNFNAAILAMNKGGPHGAVQQLHDIWTTDIADNNDGRGNGVYRIRALPTDYLDHRTPGTPLEQFKRMFDDAASLGETFGPRLLGLLAGAGPLHGRVANLIDISAMINADAFHHLVEKHVDPHAIRNLKGKTLSVIATGWHSGSAQEFDLCRMHDHEIWSAIRASAAIPALFPMVKLWKDTFMDGGVVQNTPIRPAIKAGADVLHVVSLDPDIHKLPDEHVDNTPNTLDRVYNAMLVSKIAEDIESARWVNEGIEVLERVDAGEDVDSDTMRRFVRVAGEIHRKLVAEGKMLRKVAIHRYFPRKPLGSMIGMLDFHRSSIDAMIQDGYNDTCAHNCHRNKCVIPAKAAVPLTSTAGVAY